MAKSRLEELGEQMMNEIQENKKRNEHIVTKEMLSTKLDAIIKILLETRDLLAP